MDARNNKIGFIGAGNMASSLITGLVSNGYDKTQISVSEPDAARIKDMGLLGIQSHASNPELSEWADIIILAVKPQVLQKVCSQLASIDESKPVLFISIAAGVRIETIARWLGFTPAIIRVMPNTPALVGEGMSALCASQETSADDRQLAEDILRSVGKTIWLDNEQEMDAVTAVSGSGPAYFFLLMEALIAAARHKGLSDEVAKTLVLQTALGAAVMASESRLGPTELRTQVTSPGGTTERGINTFLDADLEKIVDDAISAATKRSIELSMQLDEEN